MIGHHQTLSPPPARRCWRLTALALLILSRPAGGESALEAAERALPATLPIPETGQEKASPAPGAGRVDPSLLRLLAEPRAKSPAALADKALALAIPYHDGRVAVTLTPATSSGRAALASAITAQGGVVTATLHEVVYARLPVDRLAALVDLATLGYAAPQAQYYPADLNQHARVVSEGVLATAARRFHQAGVTGQGVKIGILDFGFQRYGELVQAGEAPRPEAQQAFNEAGQVEANTVHGAACAEIIHDMAPDAALYLAAVDGREDQIIQAAQWLARQGVDIISFSGGGFGGPLNGQSLLDRLVDEIVRRHGVLWVNAAGNEAAAHWLGETTDRNHNSLVDVPGSRADVILMQAGGDRLKVFAIWDDWGGDPQLPAASQDLDAYLFQVNPATGQTRRVARSTDPQRGRGRPLETIVHRTAPGQIYALALRATRVTRPVRVHVMARGADRIRPAVASGSIVLPATSPQALAVAAVNVRTGELEPYNSQGPTDDGRIKPDVAAPDKNLSLAYGKGSEPGRFPGTSAACPHVAGYAALFKQQTPELAVAELRQTVIQHVRAVGSPTPNNQYGYGHIDASQAQIAGRAPAGGGREGALRLLQPILDLLDNPAAGD